MHTDDHAKLPIDAVKEHVERLVTRYPTIASIWLFGSRANDEARDDSDWDLLVFSQGAIAHRLRTDLNCRVEGFDLFVFDTSTGECCNPWRSAGLEGLHWREVAENEATYRVTKFTPVTIINGCEVGQSEVSWKKAIRLWPVNKLSDG
jgi:hypothetical protein